MSRSFGARSLTTSPPIFRSPSEMSSSPAIIRSAVDFPQPDGPTRIMNSPSPISRFMSLTASKPSGYRFHTFWNVISAIPRHSPILDTVSPQPRGAGHVPRRRPRRGEVEVDQRDGFTADEDDVVEVRVVVADRAVAEA